MPFLAYLSVDSVGRVVDAHILTDRGDPFPRKDDSLGYFLGVYPTMNAAGEACADAFMNRTVVRDGVTYWKRDLNYASHVCISRITTLYTVRTFRKDGRLRKYNPTPSSLQRLNLVLRSLKVEYIDYAYAAGILVGYVR